MKDLLLSFRTCIEKFNLYDLHTIIFHNLPFLLEKIRRLLYLIAVCMMCKEEDNEITQPFPISVMLVVVVVIMFMAVGVPLSRYFTMIMRMMHMRYNAM